MSCAGMPSVIEQISLMPASAASMMASAQKAGATKVMRGGGAGLLHRFLHGVEQRQVEMLAAAFAGRDAADDLGAVGDHLLGVEACPCRRSCLARGPAWFHRSECS